MELVRGMVYGEIEKPDIGKRFKDKQSSAVQQPPVERTPIEEPNNDVVLGSNLMDFSSLSNANISLSASDTSTTKKKRNSNRVNTTGIVKANEDSHEEKYADHYLETNSILKSAIAQIDIGLVEMKEDLDALRRAKTLKNKHQYISMIQGNMGQYIGQKIAAARELNNTITKCNELEFKKSKELKMLENQDDDKKLMDMYNALISTPVGGQTGITTAGIIGPSTLEMTFANSPNQSMPNIVTGVSDQEAANTGYNNYVANMTPAQNLMMVDSNPNIQQVYVYNKATGQSYFDVIDITTGESHPEIDRLDASFLEDTHPDFSTGVATNTNIGESYPIVTIGNDSSILSEY